MIKTKNAVFLDIPKTASSFICNSLVKMFDMSMYDDVHPTRHDRLLKFPDLSSTLVYTAVRNPYAYYPSAWEFFHENDGKFETLEQFVSGNFKHIGTFTSKYINFLDPEFLKTERSFAEIEDWFHRTWFAEIENLQKIGSKDIKEEFIDLLETRKKMFPYMPDYEQRLYELKMRRTSVINDNVYRFEQKPPSQEVCDIIAEKDRIIIDHFGFTPENIKKNYLEETYA